jgi:hypothetical protein
MSTSNSAPVSSVESLREALHQAKFRQLLAESAVLKARTAVVSAEVDAKVAALRIEEIESQIANAEKPVEAAPVPDVFEGCEFTEAGISQSFPVLLNGLRVGQLRAFNSPLLPSDSRWSGFVHLDGVGSREGHFNAATRADAERYVLAVAASHLRVAA